jgi:hypothetical protein
MISSASQPQKAESQSRKADLAHCTPEVRRGMEQLLRALDYARDLRCPAWDFAVEIERLLALGLTTSALRWLVKLGYLSHAREITAPQDTDRRFEPADQNLAFAKNTCFVLTELGGEFLAQVDFQADAAILKLPGVIDGNFTDPPADSEIALPSREIVTRQLRAVIVPSWDRDTRMLFVNGDLVKRFRVPSPNQEAVLDAFQEEGWPVAIDDPLPYAAEQLPKIRLRDTIKCLNANHARQLIRFRGNGTGQRVLWEPGPEAVLSAESTSR